MKASFILTGKPAKKKLESLNFPLKTSFLDGNLGNIISFHDDGNLEDVATFLPAWTHKSWSFDVLYKHLKP